MMRRLLLLGVLLLLSLPHAVNAHGYIVRSIPEDRATLERAPVRLQYWFSEGLEPDYSTLTVTNEAGEVVATGGVADDNTALLEARLPTALPDGAYVAELRVAFASDGHVIVETRVFFVGEAVAGVEGAGASDAAIPGEVLWRALIVSATMLLFGAVTLYTFVLVPAWGNKKYRAGLLPPRVMRRLHIIVGAALVVAVTGNVLALLQQATVFFNADIGRVLEQGLWNIVRIGSRFGDVWNARMIFLLIGAALFGVALYLRDRYPEMIRASWAANGWVFALVIGASSVASHAAGSLLLPWVAIASHWLHALAVGLWAGGVAALALVLPVALKPYTGEQRRQALLAVLRRFSPLAFGAVVVVIATGIYNASNWILTPGMAATTYGGALAVKLALVGVTVGIGALHHIALRPGQYARWDSLATRVRSFVPSLQVEAGLLLVLLASVGWLSATPLPEPTFIGQTLPAPTATQTVDDLTITATLSPGGPGVNSYDIEVERGGEPVSDAAVRVQLVDPTADSRGVWHEAERIDDGLYVATGDEIDEPGAWWLLVNVSDMSDNDMDATTRAAFAWDISQDAAVLESIPPNPVHLLAMIGVVGAIVLALRPVGEQFYARLDLRPQTVAVAVGATVASVALLIFGAVWIGSVGQSVDATLNPPPEVVNNILPDADSLERGASLFAAACAWNGEPALIDLTRQLDRLRDEDLFAAVRDGWRSLPACADLTTSERWDVVNYVRTLGG